MNGWSRSSVFKYRTEVEASNMSGGIHLTTHVDRADHNERALNGCQSLTCQPIGLQGPMRSFARGIVLKIANDTQDETECRDSSSEKDFGCSQLVLHLKWPLFGVFCALSIAFFSTGFWFFTEGKFLKGTLMLFPGVVLAVTGAVILCVFF